MRNVVWPLALLALVTSSAVRAEELTLENAQPVVVKTVPEAGSGAVDSSLTEISVTFNKEMKDGAWSWVEITKDKFPSMNGKPHYLDGKRTCALPVKLEPKKTYGLWINSSNHQNFADSSGHPAVPYLLVFQTK
jgi:hypothetical protein